MATRISMEERYTILEALGSGGFGSVYKAHDTMLHREVALKRLDKSLGEDELREQLLREARVLAAMQHPNIVSIYDISSKTDCDDIVMELLQGVSLDKLVKRHLLQMSDFKNVAGQILQALASAHAAGVLHCDIKPENIMLCLASEDHYEAKIYDFGMSPPPGEKGTTTKLLGSIYVMAPELFDGGQPTPQTDLYALGCVLYYLLVGVYPFQGDSSVQVMASHITGNYVSVAQYRPDISPALCFWLDSLLGKDLSERVESCKKALSELVAIELSQQEEVEMTLPTTLILEGMNSRLIRNISVESLAVGKDLDLPKKASIFLSNSFSHSSPVGERPAVPNTGTKNTKSAIDKGEDQILPEDAEWYFTIGDKIKGPVSLDQLNKLCHQEKVTEATLVWHALLGDWVTAASCAETKAAFLTNKQQAQEEIAKLEAAKLEDESEKEEVEQTLKKEAIAWLGPEVWVIFAAMILTIILSVIYSDIRHYIVGLYLFVVLAVGLSAARVYQMRQGAKWFSVIPVVGDLYHAVTRPNTRITLCTIMVIAGCTGMVIMGYGEAKALEFRHSMAQANSDGLSYAYLNTQKQAEKLVEAEAPIPVLVVETTPVVEKLAEPEEAVIDVKKKSQIREFSAETGTGLRAFSGKVKTLKDL